MPMVSRSLWAPLPSLLVLSFGVLPAHESELRCHNSGMGRGWGGVGWRWVGWRSVSLGKEPLFASEAASGSLSRNDYAG